MLLTEVQQSVRLASGKLRTRTLHHRSIYDVTRLPKNGDARKKQLEDDNKREALQLELAMHRVMSAKKASERVDDAIAVQQQSHLLPAEERDEAIHTTFQLLPEKAELDAIAATEAARKQAQAKALAFQQELI